MRRGGVAVRGTVVLGGALALVAGCTGVRMPDPAVQYVAFGDSSTHGPAARSYPEILSGLLGAPAGAFANEGHGGEGSVAGLKRLKSLLAQGTFPNAHTLLYWQGGIDVLDFVRVNDPLLALSPEDAGYPFRDRLNQTLDEVQANIEQAVGAARQSGMEVYVATYYFAPAEAMACEPLGLAIMTPEQAARADAYIRLLNERIRQAAGSAGASVVDVEKVAADLAGDVSNYYNCNHLSEKGNEVVAEVFRGAMKGVATRPA